MIGKKIMKKKISVQNANQNLLKIRIIIAKNVVIVGIFIQQNVDLSSLVINPYNNLKI